MAFLLTKRYVLDYKVPQAFFATLSLSPPSLSVTYVFICEGSAHVTVELLLASVRFPREDLNIVQEIKSTAKYLPNVMNDFITTDIVVF